VPLKSLTTAKARLTLSSDWDVSTLNPFVGMQNAVTRSPQEISLAEAVKAYTINAAYTMRQEDKVGTIEVGKEADLIVLDRDIFSISPTSIGQTQVTSTYLRGKLVYQK
jgi:predicted amidohydrolase YtcJ